MTMTCSITLLMPTCLENLPPEVSDSGYCPVILQTLPAHKNSTLSTSILHHPKLAHQIPRSFLGGSLYHQLLHDGGLP